MLKIEIKPYIDENSMVAPNLVEPGVRRGSDNGPMFTSEFAIMLKRLGEANDMDERLFYIIIGDCIDEDGLLYRAPVPTDLDQEGPDDYYGVLAYCTEYGQTDIPRRMLSAVRKYWGFLNNNQPGKKTWASLLVRQFQLVAAMAAAAYPKNFFMRALFFPFFVWAALVIGFSCMGTPIENTDPRRLSWLLIQATKPSLMCRMASWFWYKRLYRDYGPEGMKAVAKIYYRDNHPFQRYWVD